MPKKLVKSSRPLARPSKLLVSLHPKLNHLVQMLQNGQTRKSTCLLKLYKTLLMICTSFVMPSRDLTFTAELTNTSFDLIEEQFNGRDRLKTVRYFIPPNPVGLVHITHGTGGSGAMIEAIEPGYIARISRAIASTSSCARNSRPVYMLSLFSDRATHRSIE